MYLFSWDHTIGGALVVGGGVFAVYTIAFIIYNICFHPLRRFSGPFWWRASRIPFCRELLQGTLPFRILDLHNKYGEVVRIAPNELSFSSTNAWKEIHGHRPRGNPSFEKWDTFYRPVGDTVHTDIINAPREEHAFLRRQFSHGFSERSLRQQEPLILGYVDLFIRRIRERSDKVNEPLDICSWFNFLTFDIIGDLVFGEPFGCLDQSDLHPWVQAIFQMGHVGVYMQIASHYPLIKKIVLSLVPEKAKKDRHNHIEFTKAKLRQRISLGKLRHDLIEGLLETNIDISKLEANASIMIMAGSETTATLLSGVTYYLLRNPAALEKLTADIRSACPNEEDIDIQSVNKLDYLSACLNEALRLYPPAPNGLPRVVPAGGAHVAGHHLPENSIVAIHQWAMYHSNQHFKDPLQFRPERWLGDKTFCTDDLDAVQPFHIGPRNCLGRTLAYTEMRIIMSRLLWNFDIRIADESHDWINQKIFLFWEKGPLYVFLSPARR